MKKKLEQVKKRQQILIKRVSEVYFPKILVIENYSSVVIKFI